MDEDRHPLRQLVLLLIVTGVMAWSELPEWQRAALRAKAAARTRRLVAWMARRCGHAAMRDELAGHREAAHAGYSLAYRLSQVRDRL